MNKNRKENLIELFVTVLMALLLSILVPRNRVRVAHVIFFFKHLITWLSGLLVVEKNLITYPSRLFFRKATKSSFTFEYFIYPALCVLFNLYYPEKKSKLIQFLYYFIHSGLIVGFEIFALKYTNLIHYKKWKWYWSFITIWFTYFLSRIYFKWFTKEEMFHPNEENIVE